MTLALSLQQVRGVLEAVAYAERIGQPLNRMVTVHWGALGLSDADAGRALAHVLRLWREALAARGLPFACVWVRENDDGDGLKGSHVHILAHVPATAGPGFMRRLRAWVRIGAGGQYHRKSGRVVGPEYVAGAVNTRRMGGKRAVAPGVHRVNLAKAVGYLVKGADKQTADILALEHREPGGRVIGKRCGSSENVGPRARQTRSAKP